MLVNFMQYFCRFSVTITQTNIVSSNPNDVPQENLDEEYILQEQFLC